MVPVRINLSALSLEAVMFSSKLKTTSIGIEAVQQEPRCTIRDISPSQQSKKTLPSALRLMSVPASSELCVLSKMLAFAWLVAWLVAVLWKIMNPSLGMQPQSIDDGWECYIILRILFASCWFPSMSLLTKKVNVVIDKSTQQGKTATPAKKSKSSPHTLTNRRHFQIHFHNLQFMDTLIVV